MGEKWPIQFCLQHATCTVSVGIFYMPQIYDMGQTALLPLWRKACWGFFRPKNLTASAGFEPANLGTRGQHANHQTTEVAYANNCSGGQKVCHLLWNPYVHCCVHLSLPETTRTLTTSICPHNITSFNCPKLIRVCVINKYSTTLCWYSSVFCTSAE